MQITIAKWRVRPPASNIIQKDASNFIVARVLFCLDSFLQNPLSNDKRFCRKLLKQGGGFCKKAALLSQLGKECEKIFLPIGKWYDIRAPPLLKFGFIQRSTKFQKKARRLSCVQDIFAKRIRFANQRQSNGSR